MVAITAPIFAGALFYAVGAAILRLFGISIFEKPTGQTDPDGE
jgi:hypothetical protein